MNFTQYADAETGEILVPFTEVLQQKQNEQNQKDAYKKIMKAEECRSKDNRRFLRVYAEGVLSMEKQLKLSDAGLMYRLMLNIFIDRGGVLESAKGKPLRQKDMYNLLGLKETAAKSALSRLEALNVIRKEKQGRTNIYVFNEEVVHVGSGGGQKHFTKIFKTKAQVLLDVLTDSEAGLLFKLTPYIHFKTYTLASNPFEPNITKVDVLNGIQLAAQLGIHEKTYIPLSRGLAKKGVIMKYSVYNIKNGIFFSPFLCDRGYEVHEGSEEHDYKVSLCKIFDALGHNK
jgi:hypothetical protein